jgi:hypothetical protein
VLKLQILERCFRYFPPSLLFRLLLALFLQFLFYILVYFLFLYLGIDIFVILNFSIEKRERPLRQADESHVAKRALGWSLKAFFVEDVECTQP